MERGSAADSRTGRAALATGWSAQTTVFGAKRTVGDSARPLGRRNCLNAIPSATAPTPSYSLAQKQEPPIDSADARADGRGQRDARGAARSECPSDDRQLPGELSTATGPRALLQREPFLRLLGLSRSERPDLFDRAAGPLALSAARGQTQSWLSRRSKWQSARYVGSPGSPALPTAKSLGAGDPDQANLVVEDLRVCAGPGTIADALYGCDYSMRLRVLLGRRLIGAPAD
jgi:hypothetical protein